MDNDRMLRELARTTGDGVLICDAEGRLVFWNAGAERMFGFSEAAALDRSLDIIIPPPERARH